MLAKVDTHAVKASEMLPGMIVHFYGARFRLRDDRKIWDDPQSMGISQIPVYTITGDWIGGDVIGGYFGPDTPWKFQGNDLAKWRAE